MSQEPVTTTEKQKLVEQVRASLIKQLKGFSESGVHPHWKQSALNLAADLEAKKPTIVGGRIFPEYLDGAMEESGIKLYSPDYHYVRQQLESPDTPG